MRFCDLRQKEVINQCGCKRLGFVSDLDFDPCTGKINSIIVPGVPKVCGLFGRDTEYIIPFSCVCQIGDEIVLVQANEKDIIKNCTI